LRPARQRVWIATGKLTQTVDARGNSGQVRRDRNSERDSNLNTHIDGNGHSDFHADHCAHTDKHSGTNSEPDDNALPHHNARADSDLDAAAHTDSDLNASPHAAAHTGLRDGVDEREVVCPAGRSRSLQDRGRTSRRIRRNGKPHRFRTSAGRRGKAQTEAVNVAGGLGETEDPYPQENARRRLCVDSHRSRRLRAPLRYGEFARSAAASLAAAEDIALRTDLYCDSARSGGLARTHPVAQS